MAISKDSPKLISRLRVRLALLMLVGLMVAVGVYQLRRGNHGEARLASGTDPAEVAFEVVPTTTAAPSDNRTAAAAKVCSDRLAQHAGRDNLLKVSLIASYASTAADVAADDERRNAGGYRSAFHDREPGEFEAVCWFDAPAFGMPADRVSSGAARDKPARDRLQEVVGPDGVPVVLQAGMKAELNPAAISSSGGGR